MHTYSQNTLQHIYRKDLAFMIVPSEEDNRSFIRSSKSTWPRSLCQRIRLKRFTCFTCFTFLLIVFHQWKTFSHKTNRLKDEKKSQEPKGRKYDLANSLISCLLQQAEPHCFILVRSVSPVASARRQMKPSQETRRKIKSQRVKHTPGQQSKLFV